MNNISALELINDSKCTHLYSCESGMVLCLPMERGGGARRGGMAGGAPWLCWRKGGPSRPGAAPWEFWRGGIRGGGGCRGGGVELSTGSIWWGGGGWQGVGLLPISLSGGFLPICCGGGTCLGSCWLVAVLTSVGGGSNSWALDGLRAACWSICFFCSWPAARYENTHNTA